MYKTIKNLLKGRKKIEDRFSASDTHSYGQNRDYFYSLSQFLEILRREKESAKLVTWQETLGWEPRVKFSWDKPRSFSPKEAADYIVERKLLSDHWNYFESLWQIYSGRGQEQHYFDIDIYHTTFPMGSLEVGRLKHKITIDCLLRS